MMKLIQLKKKNILTRFFSKSKNKKIRKAKFIFLTTKLKNSNKLKKNIFNKIFKLNKKNKIIRLKRKYKDKKNKIRLFNNPITLIKMIKINN